MSLLDTIKDWFGGAAGDVTEHVENVQNAVNTEDIQQHVEDATQQVGDHVGQATEQAGDAVTEAKDKLTGQQ